MKSSRAPLILSLFFFILFIVPIFYLVIGSSFFQMGGRILSLGAFLEILTSPRTGTLLINTLVLALGSAMLSITLGVIYAWIVVRTDVFGKRILGMMTILPLTMPFLVKAFAWIYLFSPYIGIVNIVFKQLFGLGASIFNIYTMGGMIFAMGLGGLPLAYLTVEPALRSLDPALEESSRVAGNGILKTLLKVTVPVLLPAILSAFLLLMIISLENFDYPFMLGTPGGIRTLPTDIYYWINQALPPAYGTAAIISVIYLILTFFAFTIYIWVTRKTYKFVVVTGKAPRQSVHRLGKWKYVAFAICFFIIFFAFILPFSTLVLMSLTSFYSPVGGTVVLEFTINNYVNALRLPLFYQSFSNTIVIALATAASGTLIAGFMSYAALKSKVKGARITEYISSIPLAFPGIVYGLAIFWTFLLLPGISDLIYGTVLPLIIALIFVRLPYSIRMVSGNLIQIADELEESSRVAGASWGRSFRTVVLPLLKGGLTNSFLYTFINSLRELGAIVFLVTPHSLVLTMLLLNLYSQHPLALNTVAAVSVLLSSLIIVALAIQQVLGRSSAFARSKRQSTL